MPTSIGKSARRRMRAYGARDDVRAIIFRPVDHDPVLARYRHFFLPQSSSASRVTAGAFEGLFRQHFLVCPFARRDRVFWIDTDIWPAACVDTDPTSCAQRLAFTGKQKTRVVHDAL